jgi:uncharacterized Ntn-hydrolase superfamily protein
MRQQPGVGSTPTRPLRPVHTFSIVARDPATGEMGAAVQSHWFAVGSDVIWAEAGVGAVATQSFIDPSYGPLGLASLRAGRSAPEALRGLLAADPNRNVRQVAMIDSLGRVAAYTGTKDIQAAGDIVGAAGTGEQPGLRPSTDPEDGWIHVGKDFSAEANLMANDKVWPAMARVFQGAKGDLAERMLAALDAAQAAGGDIRGRQSAAIIVVKAKSSGKPWADRVFDLRVDDAEEPIRELRRLVALQRAYNHMNAEDAAADTDNDEGLARARGGRRLPRRPRAWLQPPGGDDGLARGGAGHHGTGGRVVAHLQEGVRPSTELARVDPASAQGRSAAR